MSQGTGGQQHHTGQFNTGFQHAAGQQHIGQHSGQPHVRQPPGFDETLTYSVQRIPAAGPGRQPQQDETYVSQQNLQMGATGHTQPQVTLPGQAHRQGQGTEPLTDPLGATALVHSTQPQNLDHLRKTTPPAIQHAIPAAAPAYSNLEQLSHTQTNVSQYPHSGEKCSVDNLLDLSINDIQCRSQTVEDSQQTSVEHAETSVQTDQASSLTRTIVIEIPELQELAHRHAHCYSQEDFQQLGQGFNKYINDVLNQHKKEMHEQKQHYRQQIEDLSDRLSTEMNSKISANETSIENISIKNRPSKLAEQYSTFCTRQWLEAKQELDNIFDKVADKPKFQFLCDIIMAAMEVSQSKKSQAEQELLQLLSDPLHKESVGAKSKVDSLSTEIKNVVSDIMRTMASSVDVSMIVKEVQGKLKKGRWREIDSIITNNAGILHYIEASAQLSWKMVNQRPEMRLVAENVNSRFKEAYQEPQWGSSDPDDPNSVVACYVLPLLCHGEKVLVKGRVYLQLK